MLEIIELALDKYTDSKMFERLAKEVMREYGYYGIKLLGGVADEGQDATHIPLYQSDDLRQKTVFQFSLQKSSLSKIKKTLDRLKDAEIDFNKFVYVTSVDISATLDKQIKAEIRTKYSIDIDLYDREDISTVLSDFKNGVFSRYFPNMDDQVKLLYQDFHDKTPQREEALLRTTLILNYSEKTQQTFSTIYDCIVLSLLIGESTNTLSYSEIERRLMESLPNLDYSEKSLLDSLKRLESSQKLEKYLDGYRLTTNNDEMYIYVRNATQTSCAYC